jgi:hypothetical protein
MACNSGSINIGPPKATVTVGDFKLLAAEMLEKQLIEKKSMKNKRK